MTRRTPRGRTIGRPTGLTPDVEKRLLDAISAGVPIRHAALHAGIHPSTLFRWMERGETEDARTQDGQPPDPDEAPFRELRERLLRARAAVAVQNVALLAKAARGGYVTRRTTRTFRDGSTETVEDIAPVEWKAASWLLGKSFAAEFGPQAIPVDLPGLPGGEPGGAGQRGGGGLDDAALSGVAARIVEAARLRAEERRELEGGDADDGVEDAVLVEDPA